MSQLPNHIHFLGIGGIGVSAIAQLALARGCAVSGSDRAVDPNENPAVARLLAGGATIYGKHLATNLPPDAALVVASAAIPEENPEIMEAHRRGLPVVSRAQFLGGLMAAHRGSTVAIAGTHGKTTTTGMLGAICAYAGLDPTVFVGAEVAELGGNVRIGGTEGPFIAEACEAYASFLSMRADIAVVTNLEADHLDHYGTLERLRQSFGRFVAGIKPGGTAVLCADDPGARALAAGRPTSVLYGLESADADSRAVDVESGEGSEFMWTMNGAALRTRIAVPGRHNVLNALAAMTVSRLLNVPDDLIVGGILRFAGARRRQERLGDAPFDAGTLTIVDDYAHHPTEIRATIEAMRSGYPGRRIIAVFQPHLYTRTRDFMSEFAESLASADALIVTDIYPARESPIEGVRAADIVNGAAKVNTDAPMMYLPDRHDVPSMILGLARAGDVVVFMGAGSIREQGEELLARLQRDAHR